MKRYERSMYEVAEKQVISDSSRGKNVGVITRRPKATTANACSENYANPPIPEGYHNVCGEWKSGFVIERVSDRSQFVWIPVGSLDSNGTLDGIHFSEKFGRRNYRDDKFSSEAFNEPLNGELLEQIESVKKYGGFYISRYNISKSRAGKPQSVKGVIPWTKINFYDAKEVATTIESNEAIKSHLTFGAEYDSVLEWFIKSNARTRKEIVEASSEWGNYFATEDAPWELVKTGSRKNWCTNNIYDFAGNVMEWTQEKFKGDYGVLRGGSYMNTGGYYLLAIAAPVSYRTSSGAQFGCNDLGFRATLYIK